MISVLASEEFKNELDSRFFGMADDDALTAIIRRTYARLLKSRIVNNPIDDGEDLNRIPREAWDGFISQLHSLFEVAEEASYCEDEASAAIAWGKAFSYLMPLPEHADTVEMTEPTSGRSIMQLPNIKVEVYDQRSKKLLHTHENEVPSVAKDCNLVFTITNPAVVPGYALVEWTVRNVGDEAELHGDIGHRVSGIRALSTERHTAYFGRHYMDCVISVNGQVYAVRRVPVNVRDVSYPPRNPPRPAYAGIRSKLRRR